MSEAGKVYSLANSILIVAGVDLALIGGFSDSDAFEIEPASDHVTVTEGCDGSVAFADTGSTLFNVKIKLLQTSAANAALSGIYLIQKATKIAVPVVYKDTSGADTFGSGAAVIVKPPKFNRGSKITSQEWSLSCADSVWFLGGN